MWQSAHETYLESRILSADPVELIGMLYTGALEAIRDARSYLKAGDIMARARSITKASAIVIELATSLDHKRGGEISENLARLYDYILRKLTEANLQQDDELLAESLGLLTTIAEGWEGVREQLRVAGAEPVADVSPAPVESASSYADQWVPAEPVGASAHAWSF